MPTSHDPHCVFCRIVAGDLPCYKIHEDPSCLAFLDIHPLCDGHVVVIPKLHVEFLHEMPSEILGQVAGILPKIAQRLVETLHVQGYNLLQNNHGVAGQVVRHVHFHLIPRQEGDGLGYRWLPKKLDPHRAVELVSALTL